MLLPDFMLSTEMTYFFYWLLVYCITFVADIGEYCIGAIGPTGHHKPSVLECCNNCLVLSVSCLVSDL